MLQNNQLLLTVIHNPFDINSRESFSVVCTGESVREYFRGAFPSAPPDFDYVAGVNGRVVGPDYIPKPGESLAMAAVPHGGGGGGGGGGSKNPVALVATIAVIAVAAWAGPAAAGAMGLTAVEAGTGAVALTTAGQIVSGVVSGAVLATGAMLVNGLTPGPQLDLGGGAFGQGGVAGMDRTPTYSWEVEKNPETPGGAIPVLYGRRRVFPYLISQYVSLDGDQQTLNQLYLVAGHEVDNISSVEINEAAYTQYDGVSIATRLGTNSQSVISGFSAIRDDRPVSTELPRPDWTKGSAESDCDYDSGYWTRTTVSRTSEGDSLDAFGVGVRMPSGVGYFNANGSLQDFNVRIRIRYRAVGGSWYTTYRTVTGATRTAIRKFWTIDLPSEIVGNQIEIELTYYAYCKTLGRAIPSVAGATKYNNDYLVWDYYQEIVREDLRYPNCALLAVQAIASEDLSGSRPRVSCLVERESVDVWDGSAWVTKDADNPAWQAYDLMREGDLYGAGIDKARMLYSEFNDWATEITAQLISTNPYFTSGIRLDTALAQISRVARGQIVMRGTDYGVIVDKEKDPVQLFTIGNIGEDSFEQEWAGIEDRTNVLEVTWFDEDRDYRRVIDEFRMPDYDTSDEPPRKQSETLYGTTNWRVVNNFANYTMNKTRLLNQTCSFTADVDAIAIQPGDNFYLQHDLPQYGYGGRVVEGTNTTTQVEVDQTLAIEAGTSYRIMVRFADDTIEERTVSNGTGDHTNITVSSAFSQAPSADDLYTFGPVDSTYKIYTCVGLRRDGDMRVKITALEYDNRIYAAVGQLPVLPSSSLLSGVRNLEVSEFLNRGKDGSYVSGASLTWDGEAVAWDIKWKPDSGTWQKAGQTDVPRFDVVGLEVGARYTFHVQAVDSNDYDTISLTIVGKLRPPEDVENFSVWQQGDVVHFSWTHVPDADVKGYEIRAAITGTTWNAATPIIEVESKNTATWMPMIDGSYNFLIKAIDRSGNYSENATTDSLTVDVSQYANLIVDTDEIVDNNAPGTLERFVYLTTGPNTAAECLARIQGLTDTDLESNTDTDLAITDEGTNIYTSAEKDLGAVYDFIFRLGTEYETILQRVSDLALVGLTDTDLGGTDTGIETSDLGVVSYTLKYRYSAEDSATPSASSWSSWKTMTSAVQLTARHYQFKLKAESQFSDTAAEFTDLTYQIDVEELTEKVYDQTITGGNKTYTFGSSPLGDVIVHNQFQVGVTVQDSSGAYATVTKNGTTSFDVYTYNSSGTQTEKTVDLIIRGF